MKPTFNPVTATEKRNPRTAAIDTLSSLEIVTLINNEDAKVAAAVRRELPRIARAVDVIVTGYRVKPALVMLLTGVSFEKARTLLKQNKGSVRQATTPKQIANP